MVGNGVPVHQCLTKEAIDPTRRQSGEVVPAAGASIVYATSRGVGPHMTLAFAISQSISDREDLLTALHTRLCLTLGSFWRFPADNTAHVLVALLVSSLSQSMLALVDS
jgi:hypothetical protein